jgi:ADP-heptose:LPS heptosyltransferase
MQSNPPSVLIYVSEDLLGDALLKLPAISVLREAFPGHHITWLAGGGPSIFKAQLAPLIEGMVDEVRDDLRVGRSWRDLLQRPLAGRRFDVIIDTQTIVRVSLALRRAPHRLFVSAAGGFLLSDRRLPRGEKLSGNLRQRLLQLVRLASDRNIQPLYRLALPEGCRAAAAALLPEGPVYIGIAPGAGGRDKCWPLDHYLELGREQQARGRTPVYFIGPRERDWAPLIRARVPGALIPELDAGAGVETGPLLALALAQRISVGVANDAGPGHIMAAAGAPLVSLFGRASVEKFVEDDDHRQVIRAADFGGNEVALIPIAAVAEAVEEQVRRLGLAP